MGAEVEEFGRVVLEAIADFCGEVVEHGISPGNEVLMFLKVHRRDVEVLSRNVGHIWQFSRGLEAEMMRLISHSSLKDCLVRPGPSKLMETRKRGNICV